VQYDKICVESTVEPQPTNQPGLLSCFSLFWVVVFLCPDAWLFCTVVNLVICVSLCLLYILWFFLLVLILFSQYSSTDWLGKAFPKWPILCQVGCKTLTQSVNSSTASYLPKVANFSYPVCIWCPWPHSNFAKIFGIKKTGVSKLSSSLVAWWYVSLFWIGHCLWQMQVVAWSLLYWFSKPVSWKTKIIIGNKNWRNSVIPEEWLKTGYLMCEVDRKLLLVAYSCE